MKNQTLRGRVLKTEMMMLVELEDGSRVKVSGNFPRQSEVEVQCTDVVNDKVYGLEGIRLIERGPGANLVKAASRIVTSVPGPLFTGTAS